MADQNKDSSRDLCLMTRSIVETGDACSIYELKLSDGSPVYNVRVWGHGNRENGDHADISATDYLHAARIFDVIENG